MSQVPTTKSRFTSLKACVLIPTYNNATKLGEVIRSVGEYTSDIIVVNDGSTDDTVNVLQNFPEVLRVSYDENRGKGWALRQGFAFASQKGYRYAIAIDSDGQHYASDIPSFLDLLENEGDALIVGARNMEQASVPGKSSFGHKFSNFWYKVETGIALPDTQSGYRLYPLELLQEMHFVTRKYEFEIEVLVRAAWKGIPVKPVKVSVFYPVKTERITHFRPFRDFTRISILNTVLVILAFLYIKPRDFFRHLFHREKFKKMVNDHLLNRDEPSWLKALSVGFGVFMGIIPIWGFQLVAAIFLAVVFRLNKPLVILAANISIPPMIPLIIYLSYKMGAFSMGDRAVAIGFSTDISIESVKAHWEQYMYGSVTLAVVAAFGFGILSYILMKLFKRPAGIAG